MTDKDLIRIISEITAKTVADVSEIYHKEYPNDRHEKDIAKDTGTSFSDDKINK